MSSLAADRYWQAKKATLIGGLVNALLGIVKILGGAFFRSHALIADGVHSISDLLTDAMVLFASKYGSQVADDSHPYGHKRFETAATRPVVAWCLEIHDLWISKAIASRPKDLEFCSALVKAGAVDVKVLTRRLTDVHGLDNELRDTVQHRINR